MPPWHHYPWDVIGKTKCFYKTDCGAYVEIDLKGETKLEKNTGKILIMVDEKDNRKVVARDLITGKTAEARCNPDDEFDFEKGAKLAFERLTAKPKYWTGKVIYVSGSSRCFTVGKIYDVIDGNLMDDTGNQNAPYFRGIKSFEDLRDHFSGLNNAFRTTHFIEYKGGADE